MTRTRIAVYTADYRYVEDACHCCTGTGSHGRERWWDWRRTPCADCHGTGGYHEPEDRTGTRATCPRCAVLFPPIPPTYRCGAPT